MDERAALGVIADVVPGAGDDAATVDGLVVTTDMLHERTDFPAGTTRYTAGWRAVGASLSDLAATGAEAVAAVAAYGAPAFEEAALRAFLRGAREVCGVVGADYVGGDLDAHDEFTVATTAVGRAGAPVGRDGARSGDRLCVTGAFGRTAAAMALFEAGEDDRANDLFRFEPRVAAGRAVAPDATAMMDSSDGLARSLHRLSERSDCGFALDRSAVPVHPALPDAVADPVAAAITYGEDFELVFTAPPEAVGAVRERSPTPVTADGESLPDSGYTHGDAG